MNRFRRIIKSICSDQRGAVLTELALSMPLYIVLLMGTVEVGNYLLLHLKLQHTVVAVSDLATRDEEITEAVVADIFEVVPQIMRPFDTETRTIAYVSAISQAEDVPSTIYWQRSGGGNLVHGSDIGDEGDAIDVPAGLTLRDDETILATEIFYSYEPLIFSFLDSYTIRKTSYFRPRIGALQEIQP
ncbi:TadE/TadG family type IV pilus assembly protein [Kordiimonas lipolytica]|uniref:TadE/TadG family type IV pilus assembly protein n=1 Tax=Kordiimonas lipolytica TaxID=1662421 RepID=A0ABV8UCV4_9PROT|nr:TadE/TadG family type IV pilus assembly protein [Kordiimonas lipolytica]